MVKEKSLLKSKTFWINALIIVSGLALGFQEQLALGAPLTFVGALNIALRIITREAVKLTW